MTDPAVDLTSQFLRGMRLSGTDYRRIELGSSFGIQIDSILQKAQLLFIIEGEVSLHINQCVLMLIPGDVILMPQGATYQLFSGEVTKAITIASLKSIPICALVRDVDASSSLLGDKRKAIVFSGCMDFELGGFQPLIKTMPEIMSAKDFKSSWSENCPLLAVMERELLTRRAGYASILSRLADVIGCVIVRGWLEATMDITSYLQLTLRDLKVSEAINYMNNELEVKWTVAKLAQRIGLSRSVFAKRFQLATNSTPIHYLTELRVKRAVDYIHKEDMTVEEAALRLGYTSAAAFTRAYKRIEGYSPKKGYMK